MSAERTDPIVVVGMACRLPGCASVDEYEALLFGGQSAVAEMPSQRLNRELYHDSKRGRAGMTYTGLGGCVFDRIPDPNSSPDGRDSESQFDPAHLHFCDVAAAAWKHAGLAVGDADWKDTGVFVGHSGGTALGGPLGLATQIDEALDFLNDVPSFTKLNVGVQRRLARDVADSLRENRPRRSAAHGPQYNAYLAASLAARALRIDGPRFVIDGACASSLMALDHAMMAIRAGRISSAVVGGATYNGADNLILFSQSQACSDEGTCPFDDNASGLISSEGYVAVIVTTLSRAKKAGQPIHAVITGLGVSSDGRGRSLWAPRREGQELALKRAYTGRPLLDIDYLEAHATSTQLGDATELESVQAIASERKSNGRLRIGSVKSNIGHTLESAGLIGLVKVMLSLRREQFAPSINIKTLNHTFDWSKGKIDVVRRVEPWAAAGSQRRAGVSAFGIGGLNAHLHVEEYSTKSIDEPRVSNSFDKSRESHAEPIAIIGRGLVLPGAFDVEEFQQLLRDGRSAISDAPHDRWRSGIGIDVTDESAAFRSPTSRGGFITDFQFDGQKYRIPPKQVQQANPIQMMLLDAVRQAVEEFDGGEWSFNRERTAVVIGTIFGTEFGNNLQIGLRLPEICREIEQHLQARGIVADAKAISKAYREVVLKNRPALLDETGSFTASTLASRVAKTFDLMGGAGAIDADDASGLAALTVAVDKLRSGQCDTIICGAGHRAMDLSAFEELKMNGRLLHSGREEDIPDDCSRVLPGEGVVTLLLCRQSDAIRNDAVILGTIGDVTTKVERSSLGRPVLDRKDAKLVRQIGYLSGAHPLVRLVSETVQWQDATRSSTKNSVLLSSQASDGLAIRVNVSSPAGQADPKESLSEVANQASAHERIVKTESMKVETPLATSLKTPKLSDSKLLRIGASTAEEFLEQLRRAAAHPESVRRHEFQSNEVFRLSVIAEENSKLSDQLNVVMQAWSKGVRRQVFDRERAVLWQLTSDTPRVAWLFPGQGSQYAQMPSVVANDPVAAACISEIDGILASMGLATLSQNLTDPTGQLGRDVWLTQLWVLGVGTALSRSLLARGLQPDFVLGHSFGEYVAAVTAGVMSLEQAVRVIRHRSDAVIMNTRERGVLLSVKGSLNEVDSALRQSGLPLTITHNNSPTQTVVAGPEDIIRMFRKTLSDMRLASIVVPVPAPFHTSMLAEAQTAMQQAVSSESLRPPSCGFLSATCGQYLAEPNAIRRSLVTQLTQPVLYQPSVRRLIEANSLILVEVGPNDVLTRLNREIVSNDALCVSLDVPGESYQRRMSLVEAVLDCVSISVSTPNMTLSSVKTKHQIPVAAQEEPLVNAESEVEIIDVTRSRRKSFEAKPTAAQPEATPSEPVTQNGHPTVKQSVAAAENHAQQIASDQNSPVHRFLLDLVVELTGYSRDVLDFDADLEAELGLDSIKTAQIIGELAEWADLKVTSSDLRLSDIRTLADVAALAADSELMMQVDSAEPQEQLQNNKLVESQDSIAVATNHTASTGSSVNADLGTRVEGLLVDFVVDLTGYDRTVVDMEADLEAELGLDSIKIAQIVGEMQEQFELAALRADQLSLGDFRTLRSIQKFLMTSIGQQSGTAIDEIEVTSEIQYGDSRNESSTIANGSGSIEVNQDTTNQSQNIGVEPHDHLPEDWASLFQARSDADNAEDAWQVGFERGSRNRPEIRAALRLLVDKVGYENSDPAASSTLPKWDKFAEQEMMGLSSGAGVVMESVRYAASVVPSVKSVSGFSAETVSDSERRPKGTHRFALRMIDAPRRRGMPTVPVLNGPALLLGGGSLADSLASRIRSLGQEASVIDDLTRLTDVDDRLSAVWQKGSTPHLFILTPFDDDAMTDIDVEAWLRRRPRALEIPFRVCQLWMQNVIDAGLMEDASVVACSQLGGDLGFSGKHVRSPESLAGLVKAMLIECWMREFRTTPMKVVDLAHNSPIESAVDGILNELAVPSYDMEVSVNGYHRSSVQAYPAPISGSRNGTRRGREITRGGTWVVSGGGRGITAMTAMALAERYDLKLHLLGTAPTPDVSEATRKAAVANRSQLRRQVMASAAVGENPVEIWRNTEKGIEIDITLTECHRRGIQAKYHSCDVSDPKSVAGALSKIRQLDGAIHGVLHGAGAGQDSRFDRKRPDKVEKCLRAKIDGAMVLMDQTREDPLEWFAAYGSISGRFGANGHTDYSLANDMMAKLVDRYRSERPEVSSVTFHWHAWGDVGMATKPEARLALEMIDMEFMPAEEGVNHFLNEFEFGGNEPEVLITDYSYFGKFFPADRIGKQSDSELNELLPLLNSSLVTEQNGAVSSVITLDPVKDKFLSQHRVAERPTLPFVVALELMAEAAQRQSGLHQVVECRNVVAMQPIKFASDDCLQVSISAEPTEGGWQDCRLQADVRLRDGRLVEQNKAFFGGQFKTATESTGQKTHLSAPAELEWQLIDYLGRDAAIYHGPEFQCLRKIAIDQDGGWGRIASSASVQLFGANRTRGWTVPCATMDACLYAVAVVAWKKLQRASLPVRFGAVRFGRLPDPGEPCLVRVSDLEQTQKGLVCNFQLQGLNGDVLLDAHGYEVAWLS